MWRKSERKEKVVVWLPTKEPRRNPGILGPSVIVFSEITSTLHSVLHKIRTVLDPLSPEGGHNLVLRLPHQAEDVVTMTQDRIWQEYSPACSANPWHV